MILQEAIEESPRDARRFPQALWDAVGDLSVSWYNENTCCESIIQRYSRGCLGHRPASSDLGIAVVGS